VRSPFTGLQAIFHEIYTWTRNKLVKEDIRQFWQEQWETIVKHEIVAWREYHLYWLRQAEERKIPVYFFRYEDMLNSTHFVMKDLFSFLLGMKNIDGTLIEQLIILNIAKGKEAGALHEPKLD
jgi:hypothetical protein